MKRLPSTLIDFIQANRQCHREELFAITLPTGRTLYATTGQMDITTPAINPVPLGTKTARITLTCTRFSGSYNDGSADNLSLTIDGGSNLIVNPSAESGLTGWTATIAGMVSMAYGDPGFLPTTNPTGDGGTHVFSGGSGVGISQIQQRITIPAGIHTSYSLSGWFGGWTTQPDYATLLLEWLDSADRVIDSVTIGPVTNLDRANVTTLQPRSTTGAAAVTFKAREWGVWSRGPITSEAGTKLAANTMELTCVPDALTSYPGLDIGILKAALNHLFDGATVWVYRAYMPIGAYGDVSAGLETVWQGTITNTPELGRTKVKFQCADPLFLLNMKIPSRLFQANCPWSFVDSNCTLTRSDYTVTFTAASGSTQRVLTPASAFTQADGYFTQGVVTCLTGGNAGLSQTVKIHTGGTVEVMVPWILPVAAGDTFSVIKGCDKTLSTCKATKKADGTVIDNSINHGGTPFVPPASNTVA
jgi:uncharacterized phage protein (TIGR02218 family)